MSAGRTFDCSTFTVARGTFDAAFDRLDAPIAQVLAAYGDGQLTHRLAGLAPVRPQAASPTPG